MYKHIRIAIAAIGMLWANAEMKAQNPAAYHHVSNWSNFAVFKVQETPRALIKEKSVTFEVDKEMRLTFHLLVMPDGKVRYVRPPRYSPELSEFRLGGSDALYKFQFSEIDPALGDEWITVEMVVKPESTTLQAQ
jgi:hypothetical protein